MRNDFTYLAAYKRLAFLGSGDGIMSRKHDLDCKIASVGSALSHLPKSSRVEIIKGERIAQVRAICYIPFFNRGRAYVEKRLAEYGKTIAEHNKARMLWEMRGEHISENDMYFIECGTAERSWDFANLPDLTYESMVDVAFTLDEVIDEFYAAGIWLTKSNIPDANYLTQYVHTFTEREGRIVVPEEIHEILTSEKFRAFEAAGLSEREKKYLEKYLYTVDYFGVYEDEAWINTQI